MSAELAHKFSAWRRDPVEFVRDVFQTEPDAWQVDALEAFISGNRVCMRASKGVGKSTVLAWCIWNFMLTRPHPKIAVTSITADNLRDGLWTELAKWLKKSPLLDRLFAWQRKEIVSKEHPETWKCSARTWPKDADASQQADTLAGLHADYLLFVLDEVGGIPDSVMAAAEAGLASGIECKIAIAGNPTHNEGPLYRACTGESHLWKVIEVNGDPDSIKRSPRVSVEWARQQIEKYGRDNPWVKVNVFGEFPPTSINSLIGVDEVEAAMARERPSAEALSAFQKRIGVDVARFGSDASVLFPRQGKVAFTPVEMRGARTDEIASRVILAKNRWNSAVEFIDDTGGYGGGVVDAMIAQGYSPVGINFASRAFDTRFLNARAEMWFRMAKWIKDGGCLPPHEQLKKELVTPTYTFQNGKLKLEDKRQVKDRLGFSPDYSDALALTFAETDFALNEMQLLGFEPQDGRLMHEFDPFEER